MQNIRFSFYDFFLALFSTLKKSLLKQKRFGKYFDFTKKNTPIKSLKPFQKCHPKNRKKAEISGKHRT